ncbi:hypothetical protein TSTA_020440 [Talaromyces stipitatus ATCC 10500]|uniref:Tc1-like transposase DDE domain-containing protein n=1 Tax=Talaromyces stipitatus (strain ATCC 10500 / CBS 375.48 / QM 6759 / NRRL 1006) TaxID=441959 RepID=B8MFJ6_TALSN|nr:uncharacterized protein TSTA_020440 [Talaromyces stipitatus ATCC 10500]EED16986.1 hypothetical protein TSTA_020440 [Talaromyces stipitatus ATCC 10500]
MAPSTPPHFQLTRDERLQILTLRSVNMKYANIAKHLGVSICQVQLVCQAGHPTPSKRSGRPLVMKDEEIDNPIRFFTSSRYARYLTYRELALHLDLGYSEWAIRSALLSKGSQRYIARRKPPLFPENKWKRLPWAQGHLSWSPSQWEAILWSDEIWVYPGRHTLFLEKQWGTINAQGYIQHIVLLITEYTHHYPYLQLVQDGAPGHGAQSTIPELQKGGVHIVRWPPFSPDLNLIDMVNFPEKMTLSELRIALGEAGMLFQVIFCKIYWNLCLKGAVQLLRQVVVILNFDINVRGIII